MRSVLFGCSLALLLSPVARADGPHSPRSAPMPVDVDGVLVRSEADAARMVTRQLHGEGPWSAREDQTSAEGLERALDASGTFRPVFARTIAAHLEDPDVTVRTLAVVLLPRVAKDVGAPAIAKALAHAPKLFDGVKPEGHPTNQPDLRWSLLTALARAVEPANTAEIALLRKAAHEARGFWLLGNLARVDRPWLLANAHEVVPKTSLGGVLIAMPDTASRQALIRALAPWSAAERQAALDGPFWGMLPDAAQVKEALK